MKKPKTKNKNLPAKIKGKTDLILPDVSTGGLIQMALKTGAGIDQLEKLMQMKYRDEEREAEKAYFRALSEFQGSVESIKKDSKVSFGNTNYKHASLGQIEKQIKGYMKDSGLTKRFEIKNEQSGLTVTCIITHTDGHSERTGMFAPADNSGNKNTIQSLGSTVTYLQRYTLIGALGLVTADEDNDGRTALDALPKPTTAPPVRKPKGIKADYIPPDKHSNDGTFSVNDNQVKINALRRLFNRLHPGKPYHELNQLWISTIGVESKLTDKNISEMATEFTAELKKIKGGK